VPAAYEEVVTILGESISIVSRLELNLDVIRTLKGSRISGVLVRGFHLTGRRGVLPSSYRSIA